MEAGISVSRESEGTMKERDHGASSVEQESQTRAKTLVDEIRMRGLQGVSQVLARESERTIAGALVSSAGWPSCGSFTGTRRRTANCDTQGSSVGKTCPVAPQPALFPRNHRLLYGAGGGNILASHDRSRDGGTTAKCGQGGVHHLRLCDR